MRMTGVAASVLVLAWGIGAPAQATITTSGNVTPVYDFNDPWVIAGQLRVGDTGVGSVSVSARSDVQNTFGFTGRLAGSNGIVTVSGAGSTWDSNGERSYPRQTVDANATTLPPHVVEPDCPDGR